MRKKLVSCLALACAMVIVVACPGTAASSAPPQEGGTRAAQTPQVATLAAGEPRVAIPARADRGEERTPGAGNLGRFLAGGALGFGLHEGAHLGTGLLFDAHPGVRRVHFGPIPFFAVTHRHLSPRREFVVSSAGFWAQQLGNEIVLSRHPDLRTMRAPASKGLLAFNVLASVGYAGVAMAKAGPAERDTRSMAVSRGMDERAVGAIILGPALLDTARYYHPRNRWLAWGSRAAKIGMVVLVVRRGR